MELPELTPTGAPKRTRRSPLLTSPALWRIHYIADPDPLIRWSVLALGVAVAARVLHTQRHDLPRLPDRLRRRPAPEDVAPAEVDVNRGWLPAREADRTCAPGAAFAAARRVFAFLPREDPGETSMRYAVLAAAHVPGRPPRLACAT